MIFQSVLISWFSGFLTFSCSVYMALAVFWSTSFLYQEGQMFSESLFCVRSHLRCHVDFQAVKKTQPGPVDPTVQQVWDLLKESYIGWWRINDGRGSGQRIPSSTGPVQFHKMTFLWIWGDSESSTVFLGVLGLGLGTACWGKFLPIEQSGQLSLLGARDSASPKVEVQTFIQCFLFQV